MQIYLDDIMIVTSYTMSATVEKNLEILKEALCLLT